MTENQVYAQGGTVQTLRIEDVRVTAPNEQSVNMTIRRNAYLMKPEEASGLASALQFAAGSYSEVACLQAAALLVQQFAGYVPGISREQRDMMARNLRDIATAVRLEREERDRQKTVDPERYAERRSVGRATTQGEG